MTREEALAIIRQNKDVLTPENYQGIFTNLSMFSEADLANIAAYLKMGQEMIAATKRLKEREGVLFSRTVQEGQGH